MKNFLKIQFLLIMLLSAVTVSCNRVDDDTIDFAEETTEYTNLWIQDSMRRYYYWAEQMPAKPDYHLPTKDFFKSLLSSQDRFSFIVNTTDPSTYPKSVRNRFGFDYTILQLPGGEVVTVIKLVLKNSPASNSGLQRGMVIKKINGQTINASNAQQLTEAISDNTVIEMTVGNWQNGIVNEENVTVYYGYSLEQPLTSKIFEQNGKKTGYLYVYDFPDGMTSALNQKFSEFKTSGIQELILDLRYNYGGSVSSAAALCAMIPSGISANSQFITYKGNKNGGEVKRTFSQQIAYDPGAVSFDALHANSLGLSRVYVLTSRSTASAAEIVINNLKPYLEVIQVGDETLGKDMAGFSVEDRRKPKKTTWQLHPVIYKVFNANGEGGYVNGLSPQFPVNEFNNLPLLPLGDPNETLLSYVLTKIYSKQGYANMGGNEVQVLFQSDGPAAGFSRLNFK